MAPLLKLDWRWGFVATALAPVRGAGELDVEEIDFQQNTEIFNVLKISKK